ncbi:MAG TPA: hypothetical protein VFK73_03515 [Paludibacter sp.]|nr:hypothetical protein [Paludibacter sp.]
MNSKKMIFISLVFVMGCTTVKQTTTTVTPQKVLSVEQTHGKELYENRCGKCHKLFASSAYTAKQWPVILNRMQNKAKITDDQKAQVFAYLSAGARQ